MSHEPKNSKNGKCVMPMLEATARLVELMEGEVDFVLVAAFSMDEPVDKNAMGQFLEFEGSRASPLYIAKMLHSLLVQYVMRNQQQIMTDILRDGDSSDASEAVKDFMDKIRRSAN